MKKRWLVLMTAICLVAFVFVGCGESTPPKTAEVSYGNLTITVPVSGNLETHKAWLSFGTSGMVKEILVTEGDIVVKGQALAKLDVPSLEASVRMRQAEYDMVELQLMGTIFPHYAFTRAADLPGTWLALDQAQSELKDAQELLEQGKSEQAQALLDQVKNSLDKAQDRSESRMWAIPLSVKLLELQLDEAKAALDMSEAELAKATITAPFDGIVAGIEIKEGEQLSAMAYANPAICVIDTSEIKLSGYIDEVDIAAVRLGQEVVVTFDALPGKELIGKVTFISPAGESQMGVVSYKTTIMLENHDEELRDSMSATADIITNRRENVLLIPNRAIQGTLANPYVEVITGDTTEKRAITLGLSDGLNTQVLSGLEEGEKVVLPAASQFPFISFGE